MSHTRIEREEVEQLMYILRFKANSINMNYLQHPIADDLRTAADRLIALRDELDRVTARVAELEAALTYYRDTFCEGFCGEDNWSDAGHANPAIQRDCAGCRAAATLLALRMDKGDG